MSQPQRHPEDDGRTIVDMSGIDRPSMFRVRRPEQRRTEPLRQERPWEDSPMRGKERWMFVFGAMRATLLIGLAYLLGFGFLIALLLFLWK